MVLKKFVILEYNTHTSSKVRDFFRWQIGDIYTTNTINATPEQLTLGATLKVGANGILEPGSDDKMTWQVVKVYTMPDHQNGVKIMRIV